MDKEVIYFCEVMYQQHQEIRFKWKKDLQWGNELALDKTDISTCDVLDGLVSVFLHFRFTKKIKEIITKVYYFSDDHEVEKLIELTICTISERYYAAILFGEMEDIEQYVKHLFQRSFRNEAINFFDGLVSYSMKPLGEILIEAVAYAIDAYKQEEAHQAFLHAVRIYISKSAMKLPELYILQGEQFTYYKKDGRQYSLEELRSYMNEAPLYLLGLHADDMNLSPVISLAPERIYLFGDNFSDTASLSLINLFQERVHFFSADEFPFYAENMNS